MKWHVETFMHIIEDAQLKWLYVRIFTEPVKLKLKNDLVTVVFLSLPRLHVQVGKNNTNRKRFNRIADSWKQFQ